MITGEGAALFFLALAVGWVVLVNLFVAVMHAKAVLSRGVKISGLFRGPLLAGAAVGLVLDVLANFTIGTGLFLELPREFTLTSRCARHKRGHGWRRARAAALCAEFNKFDPDHC